MKSLFYIFLIFILVGCVEEMVIIPDFVAPESDRVLLIEEVSGVQCPNCPDGAAEVESIKQQFPGNIISVVLYTDFLGSPTDESKYDFRTDEARDIEDYLGAYFGKPSISVSRIIFDDEPNLWLSILNTWSSKVNEVLSSSFAKVKIQVENSFDQNTRELNVKVIVNPQEDISGDLRMSVMITESGIIDVQEGNSGFVDDYEHNHVLRTMLTSIEGEPFANTMNTDQALEREYIFVMPPEDGWWVAENCSVIAFISLVSGNEKEVLQAAESHVVE